MTRVSIIVVDFNSSMEDWRSFAESIAIACVGIDAELVVASNGSRCCLSESDLGSIPSIVLENPMNLGFAAGANSAAAVAKGEFLFFIGTDSVVHPGCVRELLYSLESAAGHNLLANAAQYREGVLQIDAYLLWYSLLSRKLRRRFESRKLLRAFQHTRVVSVPRLTGGSLFVRHELFTALGGFNEDFFAYGEDVDLSIRAINAGCRLAVVPAAVIDHRPRRRPAQESAAVERLRVDAFLRQLSLHRHRWRLMAGCAEMFLFTVAGLAGHSSSDSRRARLARLPEVWRWCHREPAPPLHSAELFGHLAPD
ncbi:MAG: hypothetical protein JWM34_4653 [Ilumatobacteraceae bacterium]|nr:hypothetical protein [Ilumatobacteraceae bacterium]